MVVSTDYEMLVRTRQVTERMFREADEARLVRLSGFYRRCFAERARTAITAALDVSAGRRCCAAEEAT